MIRIRRFRAADAAALGRIFHLAVQSMSERDYTQQQREAWSPAAIPAERYLQRITEGRHSVFVAVTEQDQPIGFIELQPDGYIDCFYRHPDHHAAGLGQLLYDRLQQEARDRGMARLHVLASKAAERFFLRQGYRVVERRQTLRVGVTLHNTLMEKHLT